MKNTVHFEKTLSSEVLFEGRVITLTKDTALLENGRILLKPPSGNWKRNAA